MQKALVIIAAWVLIGTNQALAATTIEKVLPFTPEADAVRIVITAKGNDELAGTITPWGKTEIVWKGSLGKAGSNGEVEKLLTKLPVKAWSPGSPNLYELTVTGGGATQKIRFGFRKFESKNGNFYLNGKPIFMRGLAINPPGRGVPDAVGKSKQFAHDYVAYLRKQNLNIIRMNEDAQEWFDACDELGMMVYQGVYGSPPTGLTKAEEEAQKKADAEEKKKAAETEADNPEPENAAGAIKLAVQAEAGTKRLPKDFERSFGKYKSIFETYVHHPAIVIYVLTNEMPYQKEAGKQVHEFLTRMYDRLSAWDHTRQYIGNAGYGEGHEGDINDVHRYWGWYYNSVYTFYNLRNPRLLGDYEKNQPMTFSECVGNFTGPTGAYNCIERKQLAAAQGWTGHAEDQVSEAQSYQAFGNKHIIEIFRRLRPLNSRICGLMPFTIVFRNWNGISSFDQMKPTAAATQMGASYSPILLSFEHFQPQLYAGSETTVQAHVVNDADDFSDLGGATLSWVLRGKEEKSWASGKIDVPNVPYYGTWQTPIELKLPENLPTGEYKLMGSILRDGASVTANETPIFVAGTDWKQPEGSLKRRLIVVDATKTSDALKKLGIRNSPAKEFGPLDPATDCLVIGEEAWQPQLAKEKTRIAEFVRAGGRVLYLGQLHDEFDGSWLPIAVKACENTLNDPTYPAKDRPTRDNLHVNPERPGHPVFAGVDRQRLKVWSDPSKWTETTDGFPRVYPVQYGLQLTKQEDLAHVAILGDCDQGLSGIALAEVFDGKGSVLLCGLGLVSRAGLDPVADRMLVNLATYMANDEGHDLYPRVNKPIQWGNYPTEQGVVSGPLYGLYTNTMWLQPPTDPNAPPLEKSKGAWNTRPGDQFVPHGIRPRGPFFYTFNNGVRDINTKNPIGSGIFWATIPAGRKTVVTKVENPTAKAASLEVLVNDKGGATPIPPGETITISTPIEGGATDINVRYKGERDLVILETDFQ